MVSHPMTRAQVLSQIASILQSDGTTPWTTAELGLLLDDAVIEVSEAVPYISRDIYTLESRTGTSTSTSANNLVDSGESQFASTDTGKVVYNSTDKTWAVIETYSSTSQVGLSADIFTVGEQYEIYNKGCWNKRQVNIENSSDFLWILGAVYPILPDILTPHNMRNVTVYGNKIAEIDASYIDDTKDTDADKDVVILFARQHNLNSMTDLVGATTSTGAVAATSLALGSLGSTETIYKDTLFTVALSSGITSRLTYRATTDVTTSGNAATVSFWPGLEAAVASSAVVTFIGSTLTPDLERIVVQLVVGSALVSEGIAKINLFSRGGASVPNRYYEMGNDILDKARRKLKSLIDVDLRANYNYSRS